VQGTFLSPSGILVEYCYSRSDLEATLPFGLREPLQTHGLAVNWSETDKVVSEPVTPRFK